MALIEKAARANFAPTSHWFFLLSKKSRPLDTVIKISIQPAPPLYDGADLPHFGLTTLRSDHPLSPYAPDADLALGGVAMPGWVGD
jgi:hypothetical protein